MIRTVSKLCSLAYVGQCCVNDTGTERKQKSPEVLTGYDQIIAVRSDPTPPQSPSSSSPGIAAPVANRGSDRDSISTDIGAETDMTDLSDDAFESDSSETAPSVHNDRADPSNAVKSTSRKALAPLSRAEPLCEAKEHEVLVFDAAIQSESGAQIVIGGETAIKSTTDSGVPSRLRLFHNDGRRPWETTRRLCYSLSATSRVTLYTSIWLPLGDLRLVVERDEVVLTFSDCNQDFGHQSYNYEELHDRIYKRTEPNNTLLLRFLDRSDAVEFATILRGPSEELVRCQKFEAVKLGDGGMLAQPFQLDEDSHNARGIVVRGSKVDKLSTSRLYVVPSELDLVIPSTKTENAGLWTITIKHILIPTYISDKRKLHRRDTTVGQYEKVDLEAIEVEWAFKQEAGMVPT